MEDKRQDTSNDVRIKAKLRLKQGKLVKASQKYRNRMATGMVPGAATHQVFDGLEI